jgi:hypothetical protein
MEKLELSDKSRGLLRIGRESAVGRVTKRKGAEANETNFHPTHPMGSRSYRLQRPPHWSWFRRPMTDEFVEDLYERFHVAPRSPTKLHRGVPRRINLNHVLSPQED